MSIGNSDESFKYRVSQIKDPVEMLEVLLEKSGFFGDPYYGDLNQAMWDQAQVIISAKKAEERKKRKAKEYASRINGEDKDKIRTYKGPSNEVIIQTLIEAGYSKEEAEEAVRNTI